MPPNRPSCSDRESSSPCFPGAAHRLGWQGWQINLPVQWNPVRYTGDARAGELTIADLEQVRLELAWRRTRRPERVDLDRIGRSKRPTGVTWNPALVHASDHPFRQEKVGQDGAGGMQAMLVSGRSPRMLHVHCFPPPEIHLRLEDLPALLDDHSDRPEIPWSVFGLTWSVPARFRLKDLELAAGRQHFAFAYRGQGLLFERTVLAGRTLDPAGATDSQVRHLGHPLTLDWKPLPRWRCPRRRLYTISARWVCAVCGRQFRVASSRVSDEQALLQAVRSVQCHAERAAETAPPSPRDA